jgi:Protein of unknown function with PCYCGC motif
MEAQTVKRTKWAFVFLTIFISMISFTIINGRSSVATAQESDPKAFKLLKEKSIDPKTGLPKTLDPSLFRGDAKAAYTVAKEIPNILAQMPCFCDCEPYGHENLLDCFIDNHGAD